MDLRRVLTFGSLVLALSVLSGCSNISSNSSPELEKAKKLIAQGNYEAAFMQLNQALAAAPRDPQVHLNLGWLYLYTDDPKQAAMELAKVQELAPDLAEGYHLKGSLLSYKAFHEDQDTPKAHKDLEGSIDNFKKAMDKEPNNYQTYFDLATSLTALNRSEAALKILDQGFDYIPQKDLETQVNFQIASCAAHAKLQEFDEAIADCKQAEEFTRNPASKQRIDDMIENMRLLNPQAVKEAEAQLPTAEQEQEAQKTNVIRDVGSD